MIGREVLSTALHRFRTHPLQTWLTLAGLIVGTSPSYVDVRRNVHILRGRFLDDDDLTQRAKVCVVSKELYEKLFRAGDSEEKTVRTLGMTFLVIGEFENPVDTMGNGEMRAD